MRVEVLSGVKRRRRRRWSDDEKARIVEETLGPGARVAEMTRGGCLFMKRLDRGRFIWPSASDGAVSITPAQLAYLIEGVDWRNPQQTWRPTVAG